jgi:hypothetical protein
MIGITGLLWSLRTPEAFMRISPMLNWGTAFLMAATVYYFIISLALGIGMVPFVVGIAAIESWLAGHSVHLAYISSILTGIGIGGIWFCNHGHGGARGAGRDIQLVMLAPLWLLANWYRRLGIPF